MNELCFHDIKLHWCLAFQILACFRYPLVRGQQTDLLLPAQTLHLNVDKLKLAVCSGYDPLAAASSIRKFLFLINLNFRIFIKLLPVKLFVIICEFDGSYGNLLQILILYVNFDIEPFFHFLFLS